MISLCIPKFPSVEIGFNVLIKVHKLVGGRAASRNNLSVVMSLNPLGLYKLGNKKCPFDRLYALNEFTDPETNFIKLDYNCTQHLY